MNHGWFLFCVLLGDFQGFFLDFLSLFSSFGRFRSSSSFCLALLWEIFRPTWWMCSYLFVSLRFCRSAELIVFLIHWFVGLMDPSNGWARVQVDLVLRGVKRQLGRKM